MKLLAAIDLCQATHEHAGTCKKQASLTCLYANCGEGHQQDICVFTLATHVTANSCVGAFAMLSSLCVLTQFYTLVCTSTFVLTLE